MKRLVLAFSVCVFCFSGVAWAQDDPELKCDSDVIKEAVTQAIAILQETQTQESAETLETIIKLKTILSSLVSFCHGMDFSGDGNVVSDPVFVPKGTYRVTLDMPADDPDEPYLYVTIQGNVLEGECEGWDSGWSFYLFSTGSHGEQVALNSREGCLLVWEVEFTNDSTPFTIKFEKLY